MLEIYRVAFQRDVHQGTCHRMKEVVVGPLDFCAGMLNAVLLETGRGNGTIRLRRREAHSDMAGRILPLGCKK